MLIPGHSSADIQILYANDLTFLRKIARNDNKDRLLLQAKKQEQFLAFERISAPKIFRVFKDGNDTIIDMEYVRATDFVTFTASANFDEFLETVKSLVNMIRLEFEESSLQRFPLEVWSQKVSDVFEESKKRHLLDEYEVSRIVKFLNEDLPSDILMGRCHGDMTFSNVLVRDDKTLCIFDFLNPPIETPYEDVAKFLQDVRFFWSLNKFTGQCDKTRVKIYWERAEKIAINDLKDYIDFRVLKKFQILGLFRILPYTSDQKIVQYIMKCMSQEVEIAANIALWR